LKVKPTTTELLRGLSDLPYRTPGAQRSHPHASLPTFTNGSWIPFKVAGFAHLEVLLLQPISVLFEPTRLSVKCYTVSREWRALAEGDSLGNDSHLCKINHEFKEQALRRTQRGDSNPRDVIKSHTPWCINASMKPGNEFVHSFLRNNSDT
jgi:hypothetical protein